MEAPVLNDQNQFPTEEIIFSNIGRTKSLWISLFEYIHKNYPDFSEVWRYFKDGKSWLFKVTFKSKTIFWLSVIKDSFRVTFYFNGKAEEAVNLSRIPGELKHQFSEKKDNKIRGITIIFRTRKDLEYTRELIELKLKLK